MAPAKEPRVADNPPVRTPIRRLLARQEFSLILVIVAIGIAATVKSPQFLTHENVIQVLEGSVTYFIMACGSALLIIGGGLDFSVGASFTLGGLVTAKLLYSGVPIVLSIVIGVASCLVVGVVNFVVITFWHVPPIIATLGTFYVLLGITNQITGGNDVVPLPSGFQAIAQNKIAGVPNTIVLAVVLGIVTWLVLEHTTFGVNVRALGGNRLAAIGNGLSVRRLDLSIYVGAAGAAGIAGILYASRVGSGQVNAGGASSTLDVITAVLIGGVSLLGGLGTIQGIAVGSVLLSLIDNALVLTGIPPTDNTIIVGGILISAVALDHLRRDRLYRKR
jgi:ribose transport system permease protein